MVALSAVAFWSSQNCTVLSSWIRLSSSSTLSVGASQPPRLGSCGALFVVLPAACFVRFCRKSKPGTNLPKSGKEGVSALLMNVSCRVVHDCVCTDGLPRSMNLCGEEHLSPTHLHCAAPWQHVNRFLSAAVPAGAVSPASLARLLSLHHEKPVSLCLQCPEPGRRAPVLWPRAGLRRGPIHRHLGGF